MTIRIVTDSTADLPSDLTRELDITVVPEYLRFGNEVYRDRVDISEDEFYGRLLNGDILPNTMQPAPKDFAEVYRKLSGKASGIISIHLTGKLSGTLNSAEQGKNMAAGKCPIELIDSGLVTAGLGLLVIEASKIAASGKDIREAAEKIRQVIPTIRLLALLDTLKYLALGGRIGKVRAFLGSLLNVKPLLSMKDGILIPVSQVRSRAKGIDRLLDFVKKSVNIEDLSIVYSTAPDDAYALARRIGPFFPEEKIRIARLGPALGVHGGPGFLAVVYREGR
ncbi:MAG: DegV family protein [Dehalococcoidales bacterium]|nr:DegV family protein [Dehalococcoidales bacterium]